MGLRVSQRFRCYGNYALRDVISKAPKAREGPNVGFIDFAVNRIASETCGEVLALRPPGLLDVSRFLKGGDSVPNDRTQPKDFSG